MYPHRLLRRNGLGSPAKAAELYQSLRASRTALQTLLTRKNAIAGDRTMPKEQRAEEGRRVRAEIVEVEAENGRLEEVCLPILVPVVVRMLLKEQTAESVFK